MRAWVSTYPAKVVKVLDADEILFSLNLGFGITLETPIGVEYSQTYDHTQKIFVKRRLEHILNTTENIVVEMYWDPEGGHFCDVLVNGNDLIDLLESNGLLR
jgi:hypothetical protein